MQLKINTAYYGRGYTTKYRARRYRFKDDSTLAVGVWRFALIITVNMKRKMHRPF